MSHTEISKCAGPNCHQRWHLLGEGKLFTFHVRNGSSDARSVRHAWLCENCFESWEATLEGDKIVLNPVYQRAS